MRAHRRCGGVLLRGGASSMRARFRGEPVVLLRKHSEEMRDLYANEIAAAVHDGVQPSRLQLESWATYHAAARSADPGTVFAHAQ